MSESGSKPVQPLTINVDLKIGRDPAVKVKPHKFPVEQGPMEIIWVIGDDSHVKDFKFFAGSLELHGNPLGFSHERPRRQHSEFSVHNECATTGEITYTLAVEHNGRRYDTKCRTHTNGGDPSIHNK